MSELTPKGSSMDQDALVRTSTFIKEDTPEGYEDFFELHRPSILTKVIVANPDDYRKTDLTSNIMTTGVYDEDDRLSTPSILSKAHVIDLKEDSSNENLEPSMEPSMEPHVEPSVEPTMRQCLESSEICAMISPRILTQVGMKTLDDEAFDACSLVFTSDNTFPHEDNDTEITLPCAKLGDNQPVLNIGSSCEDEAIDSQVKVSEVNYKSPKYRLCEESSTDSARQKPCDSTDVQRGRSGRRTQSADPYTSPQLSRACKNLKRAKKMSYISSPFVDENMGEESDPIGNQIKKASVNRSMQYKFERAAKASYIASPFADETLGGMVYNPMEKYPAVPEGESISDKIISVFRDAFSRGFDQFSPAKSEYKSSEKTSTCCVSAPVIQELRSSHNRTSLTSPARKPSAKIEKSVVKSTKGEITRPSCPDMKSRHEYITAHRSPKPTPLAQTRLQSPTVMPMTFSVKNEGRKLSYSSPKVSANMQRRPSDKVRMGKDMMRTGDTVAVWVKSPQHVRKRKFINRD